MSTTKEILSRHTLHLVE